MKMLVGSEVKKYHVDTDIDRIEREFTNDDLRVSSLEDVDNLEEKENT